MTKEEIVERLKFMLNEINYDINKFEETHDFEHIYDFIMWIIKKIPLLHIS